MHRFWRAVMLSILAGSLSAAAAAQTWSITDLEEDQSYDNVSSERQTAQIIRLYNDTGGLISEEQLDSTSWVAEFQPGKSTSFRRMRPLGDGYWGAFLQGPGSEINLTYRLRDTSASSDSIERYENLTVGDLEPLFTDSVRDRYKAGKEYLFEAKLEDEVGNSIANADVNLVFAGTDKQKKVQLGYKDSEKIYTNVVEIPDTYNETMALHLTAAEDGEYINGSSSREIQTYPRNLGEPKNITSEEGCSSNSFPEFCEPGANLSTEFEVLFFSASDVTVELYRRTSDTKNLDRIGTEILTEDSNGIWTGQMQFPDIDASEYDPELIVKYNATVDGENFATTRMIEADYFEITDRSNPTAYRSDEYTIKLATVTPFTLEPVNSSRLSSGSFTIEDPSGNSEESFSLSDMTYNNQASLYEYPLTIASDAETGTYTLSGSMENLYGVSESFTSAFEIEPRSATFGASTTTDITYESFSDLEGGLDVNNRKDEVLNLTYEASGDLSETFQFNEDNLTVDAGGSRNLSWSVTASEVANYEGTLTLMDADSNYNRSFDMSFTYPDDCSLVNGTMCLNSSSTSVVAREPRIYNRTVELQYFGENTPLVLISGSGDVSEYVSAEPSTVSTLGETDVTVSFTPVQNGSFEGDLNFVEGSTEIAHSLTLDAEAKIPNPSFSVPASISGSATRGGDFSSTVSVTNTGNVQISGLEVTSSIFSVSLESSPSIPPGATRTVNLQFTSVESPSGRITFRDPDSGASAGSTVSVQLSAGLSQDISAARTRLQDLQSRTRNSTQSSRLSQAELTLSQAETALQTDNTQRAEQLYSDATETLDEVERSLSTDAGPPPTQAPVNESPSRPGSGEETSPSSDGGGGLIILIVVVLVLALVGFVTYTSIELEEGDPLYGILEGE